MKRCQKGNKAERVGMRKEIADLEQGVGRKTGVIEHQHVVLGEIVTRMMRSVRQRGLVVMFTSLSST